MMVKEKDNDTIISKKKKRGKRWVKKQRQGGV